MQHSWTIVRAFGLRRCLFARNNATLLLLGDKLIMKTGLGDDHVQMFGGQVRKLKIRHGQRRRYVLLDSIEVDRRTGITTGWGEEGLDEDFEL